MVSNRTKRRLDIFSGTDIEVYGVNTDRSIEGAQIQVHLDDGPALTFNVPVPQVASGLVGNIPLFAQTGLEQKKHTLNATLMTNGKFMLDYILVTPGVKTSKTSTSGPSDQTSSNLNPKISSSLPVGAIAGGVVGGVIGLLLVFCVFWFLRKRRVKPDEGITIEPPEADPCMSLSMSYFQCSC
jgi:hypothetical protein